MAGRPHNTTTTLGKLLVIRKMRVADLAAATGIHTRTISDYLAQRADPSMNHYTAMAEALEVDPQTLMLSTEELLATGA